MYYEDQTERMKTRRVWRYRANNNKRAVVRPVVGSGTTGRNNDTADTKRTETYGKKTPRESGKKEKVKGLHKYT